MIGGKVYLTKGSEPGVWQYVINDNIVEFRTNGGLYSATDIVTGYFERAFGVSLVWHYDHVQGTNFAVVHDVFY